MRLIIKRCKQDYRARFLILDELGGEKYHVLGEQKSRGGALFVMNGEREMAQIRQRGFLFFTGYGISIAGIRCATVIQNLYNLHTMLRISGVDWSLRGDIHARNFDLVDREGKIIMTHAKRWGMWGDGFEIIVSRPEYELVCLCVALCIDWVIPMDGSTVVAINS